MWLLVFCFIVLNNVLNKLSFLPIITCFVFSSFCVLDVPIFANSQVFRIMYINVIINLLNEYIVRKTKYFADMRNKQQNHPITKYMSKDVT